MRIKKILAHRGKTKGILTISLAIFTAGVLNITFVGTAEAANWFKLRGTEPGGTAHTLQVWGFLQPTFAKDFSDPITGGVGPLVPANGTLPVPGTLPPDRNSQQSFFMRRARLGVRGTMVPISNDVDYFFLTEFGENGVTRGGGAAHLLDASVTLNQLAGGYDENGLHNLGTRFRLGQFLFSQTSEALSHSTPGRRVHLFLPEATSAFALTRRVNDNGPGNFPGDVSVNGARDIGIELFDYTEFGNPDSPYEFTYSLAVGNGDTIGELDRDDNLRNYLWLSIGRLLDNTRGPRRHDWMLYTFMQRGDILFNNDVNGDGTPDHTQINPVTGLADTLANPIDRIANRGNARDEEQTYWGVGFEYFDKPFADAGQIRFEVEYQKQEGLVFDGTQSPSIVFNQGVRYNPDSESDGFYIDLGYDIHQTFDIKKRTTINLRYDELDRNIDNDTRRVKFKTWTLTGEYFFHKKARLAFSYQLRDFSADDRVAGGPRINGNAALEQIDQRIGLQLTFIFKNVLLR